MRLHALGFLASLLTSSIAASVVVTAAGVAPLPGAASSGVAHADAPAAAAPARFDPLPTPTRLLDTRVDAGGVALGPAGVATVSVTGTAPNGTDLPEPGATVAAVLNVTVVGPAAVGFWTAYPHGAERPLAASLYVDERASMFAGALAIPNLVTVPVGDNGKVDIFSQSGGHLVVDMLGTYQLSGPTAAGRLAPLPVPQRILDTRSGAFMDPDTSMVVNVPGANGASAAVLSVTTIAVNQGFWTMYPTGTARPLAANLNSLHGLHFVANQVIVPLDATGSFEIYSQGGGHVIADLTGFITGAGAPVSTDGLFVPLRTPTRFLDTRDPARNPLGGAQMPLPGWSFEVPVATHAAIARADVSALAMNVTVTDPLQSGYVTVTPAGTNDPAVKLRSTSTVYPIRAGQVVPNHATVAVSPRGFDVFTLNGAHVIADVAGYYTGTPAPAVHAAATNTAVAAQPGCIGYPTRAVQEIVTGSSRDVVAAAQQRLLDLGFWHLGADGGYGLTTSQAVMAFQKWKGLPRTTRVDEVTAMALNTTLCRPVPTVTSGDLVEIDKGRQIMFITKGGVAQWVVNVSTGGNYFYTATDKRTGGRIEDYAITPTGDFRVYRVHDTPKYEGSLGALYRPRFVVGGVAVHGYSSVPNYPASHGCIRVTNSAMDMIWATNAMPLRGRVLIHD